MLFLLDGGSLFLFVNFAAKAQFSRPCLIETMLIHEAKPNLMAQRQYVKAGILKGLGIYTTWRHEGT